MKHAMIAIVLFAGLSMVVVASESETIPHGAPPLLNGTEGEKEWQRPGMLECGTEEVLLRLKQDSLYVYIAVSGRDTVHSGIDLYLDNMAGGIMMLHVSSAHGERRMEDSLWSETVWGPPRLWSSNIVESIFEDDRLKFISPDLFEFQIDRDLLPARTFKLAVHLKRPEKWVPAMADTLSSHDWIELALY